MLPILPRYPVVGIPNRTIENAIGLNVPLALQCGQTTASQAGKGLQMSRTRNFVYPDRKGKTCPVCGQSSYSKDGIHPQCSVQLADEKRAKELLGAKKKPADSNTPRKSWNKQCPKCKNQLHVRRKQCDCGHKFSATKQPSGVS